MKVDITGYGVVGEATAGVMQRLGHTVVVHDTNPERIAAAASQGFGPRHEAKDVEVDFVCVPEGYLEAALTALPAGSFAVIRVTVVPGTIDRLSKQFDRSIAYVPEFLREATAQWDALNPQFLLIGSQDRDQSAMLAALFAPLTAQVIQVTPPVAEMAKITLNAYLHTVISFWNEIHLICEQIGIPSHLVGKLCANDPRVTPYGATMHGWPVGGGCLPKDIAQLIEFATGVDCTPDLLREVQRLNEKLAAHKAVSANGNLPLQGHGALLPDTGLVDLR